MPLEDYKVDRDKFECDKGGRIAFGLPFPCCCCRFQKTRMIEDPCCKCGHNKITGLNESPIFG